MNSNQHGASAGKCCAGSIKEARNHLSVETFPSDQFRFPEIVGLYGALAYGPTLEPSRDYIERKAVSGQARRRNFKSEFMIVVVPYQIAYQTDGQLRYGHFLARFSAHQMQYAKSIFVSEEGN